MPEISVETLHELYRGYCLNQFPYTPGSYPTEDARQAHINYDARSYYEGGGGHVGSLAELVQAAYNAGAASLGELVEDRQDTRYETELWFQDGTSDEFSHVGRTVSDASVMASAEKDIGPWDARGNTVVRSEARSFTEVTYRRSPKVLARFGDWSGVPDA